MAEDVRRVALSLPGVTEGTDRFAFSVENKGKQKGIAWVWLERVEPPGFELSGRCGIRLF